MSEPMPKGDKGADRTLLRWRPPSSTQQLRAPMAESGVAPIVGDGAEASQAAGDEVLGDDALGGEAVHAPRDDAALAHADTLEPETRSPMWDDEVLPEGTLIGERYVIEHHVSSGSFGAVYKASDRLIDQHAVALKILHKAAASEEAEHAALRELRLIASVAHPSVVQFKDYGWVEGRLWFAMPWYEGRTLHDRLMGPDGERLSLTRRAARPIFERLAHGLAAMHSVGVRHHDIKPENVFLSEVAGFDEGLPVLLDLGIAAEAGEQPAGFTTEYAAPETAARALGRDPGNIGDEADVFALALTLRAALEPETMPECEGPSLALLHRRASTPIPPPTGRDVRYLAPAFKRWLSLEPSERPSAEDFARELAVLTEPEERREARRRLWRRILPLLALALTAVAALTWKLRERTEALSQQTERLSEQMEETERLRQWSNQTLAELESQVEVVGEKDKQLRRALEVARHLDAKWKTTNRDRQIAIRNLKKVRDDLAELGTRHSELAGERDDLVSQRDALRRQQRALEGERDRLTSNLVQLAAERDEFEREGRALQQERERLLREVGGVRSTLANLEQRLRDTERQSAMALEAREALRVERDRLAQQARQMERELGELRRRLAARDRGPGQDSVPAPSPTGSSPPVPSGVPSPGPSTGSGADGVGPTP